MFANSPGFNARRALPLQQRVVQLTSPAVHHNSPITINMKPMFSVLQDLQFSMDWRCCSSHCRKDRAEFSNFLEITLQSADFLTPATNHEIS